MTLQEMSVKLRRVLCKPTSGWHASVSPSLKRHSLSVTLLLSWLRRMERASTGCQMDIVFFTELLADKMVRVLRHTDCYEHMMHGTLHACGKRFGSCSTQPGINFPA